MYNCWFLRRIDSYRLWIICDKGQPLIDQHISLAILLQTDLYLTNVLLYCCSSSFFLPLPINKIHSQETCN